MVKTERKTVVKASGLWMWPKLGSLKTSQVVIHMVAHDLSSWQGMTGFPDPAKAKHLEAKYLWNVGYVVFATLPWRLCSSLPSD